MTGTFLHKPRPQKETSFKQILSIPPLDMTFPIIRTSLILECLNFQISISKQTRTCLEDLTHMWETKRLQNFRTSLFWTRKEILAICHWWNLYRLHEKKTSILMKFQAKFKNHETIILKESSKVNKLWTKFSKN